MRFYPTRRIWIVSLLAFGVLTNIRPPSQNKKLPDLVVTLTGAPATVVVGHPMEAVADVFNQGKRPASAFRLRFFLSTDSTITTEDIDTGTSCEIEGLSKRKSRRCSVTINIPGSLRPGQYFLGAIVDDRNSVAERDESNNSISFGPLTINAADDVPPPVGIVVDGDPSDWATIPPILTDRQGDGPFDASGQYQPGSDFLEASVTNDNDKVFFLFKFAGTPFTGGVTLYFDTDVNPSTGCNGFESTIHTSPAEPDAHLAFADYRGCISMDSFPGAVASAVREQDGHSFVEFSIRQEDLFRFTPGGQSFRFYAAANFGGTPDTIWPPTVYTLTARYPDGANLRIAFDSEAIVPDFSKPCGAVIPGWHYALTLTETAGVGVTITSYKTVLYDAEGGYLMTLGTNSGADFASRFGACGAESDHILANGKACSQGLCLNLDSGGTGGQIDITFSGVDDKGHQVRFTSGRLFLHTR